MKRIEILFPEFTNIYGEYYSVEYLKRCSEEIEVIYTNHRDTPAFLDGSVDLVYMGCMTEAKQEQVIEILRPYTATIRRLIENMQVFLITGNSIEIFGKEIEDNGRTVPALGIFDFTSRRQMNNRHNSQYVGKFGEMTMIGHRSQYSFSYGEFKEDFIDVEIGIGMNPETKKEGIRVNNFYATYSLGPYLILNPYFTKYLLGIMGLKQDLAFEKEIIEAYEYRLKELRATLG